MADGKSKYNIKGIILERGGWHVTAIARDCHDCTVEDSDPTVDVSEDQERFDLMFDEIVRGENNQS